MNNDWKQFSEEFSLTFMIYEEYYTEIEKKYVILIKYFKTIV